MFTVRRFCTEEATPQLLQQIHHLLVDSFAGDFSEADWEHSLGGWHVVVVDRDVVLSHAAVVPRVLEVGGRPFRAGYVEGVATALERRLEGLASRAMAAVSELVRRDHEMGALSTSHHGFYAHLGWERWRGPTYVRHGSGTIRTADEDAGVMVLRFGPSKDIDLTAPISCDARRGDDW